MAVNVRGTSGILEAARIAGVERCVVTSSSAALPPAPASRPATERDWAGADHHGWSYHASKLAGERAALRAPIAVTTVLPTAPVGPGDHRPTPTGKIIVDLLRGRMPATLGGGMNIVPVEDVAAAHVLALERGRAGERYIAGGVNLSLAEMWRLIARAAGKPERTFRLPYAIAMAAARVDAVRVRMTGAVPGDSARRGAHGPSRDVLVERESDRRSWVTARRAPMQRWHEQCVGIASTAMPPEAPVHAICAMGVEAWGVHRRAPQLRIVRSASAGGRRPACPGS